MLFIRNMVYSFVFILRLHFIYICFSHNCSSTTKMEQSHLHMQRSVYSAAEHLLHLQFEWKNHRNPQRWLLPFTSSSPRIGFSIFYFQSLWYLDFMCESSNMQILIVRTRIEFLFTLGYNSLPSLLNEPVLIELYSIHAESMFCQHSHQTKQSRTELLYHIPHTYIFLGPMANHWWFTQGLRQLCYLRTQQAHKHRYSHCFLVLLWIKWN